MDSPETIYLQYIKRPQRINSKKLARIKFTKMISPKSEVVRKISATKIKSYLCKYCSRLFKQLVL